MDGRLMSKGPKTHPMWYIFLVWTCVTMTYYSVYHLNQYRVKRVPVEFLINSQNSCGECRDEFLLLILVHTSLPNIKKRTAIRETWGKHSKCVKVLYLMGTSDDENLMQKVKLESEKYQDIVQGDFLDTYRNLTYKHVMGLKWASWYCPQARYVVKADDDVMVRPDILYDLLNKDYWGAKDLIACTVRRNTYVFRQKSRWSVTKEEYSEDRYPDYCLGPFIIYSADVVQRLLEESYRTPYFWIDDVYVSGILAKKIGLKSHINLYNKWYFSNTDALEGPGKAKRFIYGPIELTPEEIYEIWNLTAKESNATSNS